MEKNEEYATKVIKAIANAQPKLYNGLRKSVKENIMKKPKILGLMIDVSRNAVMSVEALKNISFTLNNCVFLYMEDTYEVEGEP